MVGVMMDSRTVKYVRESFFRCFFLFSGTFNYLGFVEISKKVSWVLRNIMKMCYKNLRMKILYPYSYYEALII